MIGIVQAVLPRVVARHGVRIAGVDVTVCIFVVIISSKQIAQQQARRFIIAAFANWQSDGMV